MKELTTEQKKHLSFSVSGERKMLFTQVEFLSLRKMFSFLMKMIT